MFEAAACGHSLREARDVHGEFAQEASDVVCGGLALYIRAEREDHLGGFFVADSDEQFSDTEVLRADMIERGDASAERVVAPAKYARAFEREDIGGLLDDAEQRAVAVRVRAKIAQFSGGEVAAARARMDLLGYALDRAGDVARAGVPLLHHPQSDALGAARADAGHPLEFGDERLDGCRVRDAFHDEGCSTRASLGATTAVIRCLQNKFAARNAPVRKVSFAFAGTSVTSFALLRNGRAPSA